MEERILIVDDEKDICEILQFNLANEGFHTDIANSGEEALAKLSSPYSLILLDVMMSGISGYNVADLMRKNGNDTPIIFITAKDTETDLLTGFSVGGDDYISKPFSVKEVVARVKAVLKRKGAEQGKGDVTQKIVVGDFLIDPETKEFFIAGESIKLTKTEFEIMMLLANNTERVMSRELIINTLWKDSPYITERTVDVHINRIRNKIGERRDCVSNLPGYGYRLMIDK